jgi:hypothetical protein
VRSEDLAVRQRDTAPSLIAILFFLLILLAFDLVVHLAAAHALPLPGSVRAPLESLLDQHHWIPLAVKAAITALGIGGVFWWLWRVTREDKGWSGGCFSSASGCWQPWW